MDLAPAGLLRLNLETRAYHDAADDGWLGLLHPCVTRTEYVRRLVTTYGFEAPLEAAVAYTPNLKPFIDVRRCARAGLIAKDLLYLGLRSSEVSNLAQCMIEPFNGPVEALGWMYVAERATLLHDRIRRHLLARLPDAHEVCAYLSAYDGAVNARWNELGHAIDAAVRTELQAGELIGAARSAFRRFIDWCSAPSAFARGA